MMDSIATITHHSFNKLSESQYQQGNEYVTYDSSEKNYFIKIPNTRNPKRNDPKPLDIQESKSLFDSFVFIIENHIPLDMKTYIENFKHNLSDVVLKEISKRHRVLKTSIFDFVDTRVFALPENKDVLTFFSRLIESNIVVCHEQYFRQVIHPSCDSGPSYLVSSTQIKKFDSHCKAVNYAISTLNCLEACDYKSMKISDLKEYLKKYNIPHLLKSDKASLIANIEDFQKKI